MITLRTGQPLDNQTMGINKPDGNIVWISVNTRPLYIKGIEKPYAVVISITDITERKQHEEALKESEERFRAVAESSPDAILISDQNGDIIFWNNAATEMFGYEEKGIVGKSYTMLLPERLRYQDQKAGQKFLETGMLSSNKQPLETIALRKDGSEFPIEITFSSWKVQGQYCFSFIMRDITQRKQQEAALKESEERFRAVAESSSDAIWISDQQGNIDFWNKAAGAIFGYEEKDMLGKSAELLMPRMLIHRHRKEMETLMQKGATLLMSKPIETVAVRKGGTEFPVEITVSNWKTRGRYYFSTILRDITERKRAEKELEQEKYFSDTVINSLPGFFYLLDEQGHRVRWNKNLEDVTGYSAKELQHLNALALIHEDDRARAASKMKEAFVNGQVEGEAKIMGKHGKVRHYFFTGRRLEIEGKSYLAGVGIDISDRKRMEQELQKAHDELEKRVKQRTAELAKANKQLQISQEYLKKFSGKLLSVREEERKNISTTLHDELGSMAVSVGSKISIAKEELTHNNAKAALKSLSQGETVLRETVADIRKLAVNLRPPNLEVMGLSGALRDYIETIKKHSTIRIIFRNELGNRKIPEDKAIVVYRVTQEALTNITKHAKAKNVRVRLYADNKNIILNISDDGKGFDINKIHTGKGRLKIGIEGMRERVESLGGELVIKSILREGTLIKAVLPKIK
jgi:PAS domain S-box-containing protein